MRNAVPLSPIAGEALVILEAHARMGMFAPLAGELLAYGQDLEPGLLELVRVGIARTLADELGLHVVLVPEVSDVA